MDGAGRLGRISLRVLALAVALVTTSCAARQAYEGPRRRGGQVAWLRYEGEGAGVVTHIDGTPVKLGVTWGMGMDKFEVLAGAHTIGFSSPFYRSPERSFGLVLDVDQSHRGNVSFQAEPGHTYQFFVNALTNAVTVKDLP